MKINQHKNNDNFNQHFGKILEATIKQKFANQSEFADSIGVTQATVSRYIAGQTKPSFSMLNKIAQTLNINIGELNPQETPYNKNIINLPYFLSEVSAGIGLSDISGSAEYISFDITFLYSFFNIKNIKNIFLVKVKGDSMEPVISEGDLVIAEQQLNNHYSSQDTYIVCYNDDYFIKKVQFLSKNKFKLISNNHVYDPIIVDLTDETMNFKIISKVLGRINIKNL